MVEKICNVQFLKREIKIHIVLVLRKIYADCQTLNTCTLIYFLNLFLSNLIIYWNLLFLDYYYKLLF